MAASEFRHPFKYAGSYSSNWAGYKHLERLADNSGWHIGDDYNGPGNDLGTTIKSIAAGRVEFKASGWNGGFGNAVVIRHPLSLYLKIKLRAVNLYSIHCHMKQPSPLAVGQHVSLHQPVGQVGNSGNSSAPHDHLMLKRGKGNGWFEYPKKNWDYINKWYLSPYKVCQKY